MLEVVVAADHQVVLAEMVVAEQGLIQGLPQQERLTLVAVEAAVELLEQGVLEL
tara:strand:+ start:320 stop:481 length:162 start_codon:yes stop_codon:yes gene_type:complete